MLRAFAVAVLLGTVLAVTPIDPPGGTAMPAVDGATTIRLVSLDPWVQHHDTVTATLRVLGAPEGGTLTPVIHAAVPNRSSFQLTTAGENFTRVVAELDTHELGSGTSTLTVRFTVDDGTTPADDDTGAEETGADDPDDRVTLTGPGVHPLTFTVRDADGVTTGELVAYVVRLPATPENGSDGRRPLRVASEFRLQPDPQLTPAGDLTLDESTHSTVDALLEGLEASDGAVRSSFGFTVSPALVDVLTTVEADSDESRTLMRLAGLTDGVPLQSQPWSPIDLAGWLATPELEPLATRSAETGDAVLSEYLHAPTRDTTDVAAWGGRPSEEMLRWFATRGTTAFLLEETALDDLDTAAFPRTLAAPFLLELGGGRTAPAVQIDRGFTDHFVSDDPVLGANQLVADLAVVALDLPAISRGVVVAPPVGWNPSVALLDAYVDALAGADPDGSDPLVEPTPLAALIADTPTVRAAGDTAVDGPPLQRSLREGAAPRPLSGLGDQMTTTAGFVESFASMVPGDTAHTREVTARFRRQMSVAAMPDVAASSRAATFTSIRDQVTATAESVRLPSRQTITLTSDSASLPLTFRRPDDGPTEVLVHIDAPDRLRLLDGATQTVHLEDTTTRFAIRVHSDSPGDTIIRLTVTSPDNQVVVGTTEVVVRSTAASGVGFIISFGSLAFLIVWWGRDIIRTRRRRRARHIPPAQLIDID